MAIGRINKLVHLSQQTYQPNSKLIPGHNDKGYGTIDDEDGREVYFSHDAVPGSRGFDDLHRGQTVEYTLENGPHFRATVVKRLGSSNEASKAYAIHVRRMTMKAFRVWLRRIDGASGLCVDGLENAKWLLSKLSDSFVFKTSEPLREAANSPDCTFRVAHTSQLSGPSSRNYSLESRK